VLVQVVAFANELSARRSTGLIVTGVSGR
jgi:hypothetical protein